MPTLTASIRSPTAVVSASLYLASCDGVTSITRPGSVPWNASSAEGASGVSPIAWNSPTAYVAFAAQGHNADFTYSTEEEESVRERLRALGYLE